MPVTRRRAAVAAVAQEEGRDAAIYISSDSDAGSDPEDSESEEEEDTSDEDFIDVSDSEADDGESSDEEGEEDSESEAEAEAEQLGADRSEVACNKIAGLLSSGRSLEGLKLAEYKVYLKKNGLSQTGGMDTCVDRIVLHWRFKDADPRRIYPRSSFCINCKGDVCRGDAVLFKQKVYEKSGKRHAKCIGNRIVAGKVIKESYGKQKQQHTFTIQVFWSKGPGKLPPLHLLLVKGRNLYRMMTFRQPWANEAERLKILEEKHNRGDDARRVRALNRPNSAGNSNFTHLLKARKNCTRKSTSLDLKDLTANLISPNWIKAKNDLHNPPSPICLIKDLRKKGPKFLLGKRILVVGWQRKMVPAKIRAFVLARTALYAKTIGRSTVMLPFRKSVTLNLSTTVHLVLGGTELLADTANSKEDT
uniref:DUF7699 domain-containing protein n=2 Tax=Zea mays TaxID=4577 RepID=A0A804MT28_MAIZE